MRLDWRQVILLGIAGVACFGIVDAVLNMPVISGCGFDGHCLQPERVLSPSTSPTTE